ncbi:MULTISPECIES: nickel-binding protein [unclassified Carboxylicivirga]|uniref:nickel-binding protein n=1 Tax=Carboxylicivirga TaxID=1628153 RepID=UPI003D3471AE
MPIYMDRHDLPGVTAQDVAEAHGQDLKVQHLYDCRALTYWFDEERQTAFCLIEAPNKEAVTMLHKNAHGLVPHQIIEVNKQIVESFLGRIKDPEGSKPDSSGYLRESALRFLLTFRLNFIEQQPIRHNQEELARINKILKNYNGRMAESIGQVLICSFTNATAAIQCASEMRQMLLTKVSSDISDKEVKLGLYAGTPVDENNELFGQAVNISGYLCFISSSNTIVVSPSVKEYCDHKGIECWKDVTDIKFLTQTEEHFLAQLIINMKQKISSTEFSMGNLAQVLGLSQSQLYRNVVALSHKSPGALFKALKLDHALSLMKRQDRTLAEIAFESGFGSPSYFTKCFKKRFNISPSSYLESSLH